MDWPHGAVGLANCHPAGGDPWRTFDVPLDTRFATTETIMRATNFSWRDSIHLVLDGKDYDLHNDFNFRQLTYDPASQFLLLVWELGAGDWVSHNQARKLLLRLQGVTHFSFKARDPKLPFSEDDCLACFGYDNDETWADGQFWVDGEPESDWHWSFIFQSGAEIEVAGDTASIEAVHD